MVNLKETIGENGSVVTEYQYDQNNHNDSQFIQEHLGQMDKQEEQTVIVTDGAYSGTENTQLTADKNAELITTSLTGKPSPDILADFEFNEEGAKVLPFHYKFILLLISPISSCTVVHGHISDGLVLPSLIH